MNVPGEQFLPCSSLSTNEYWDVPMNCVFNDFYRLADKRILADKLGLSFACDVVAPFREADPWDGLLRSRQV